MLYLYIYLFFIFICYFVTRFTSFLADKEPNARRTEPIDELVLTTIYGIQFSGQSAQENVCFQGNWQHFIYKIIKNTTIFK